MSVEWVRSCYSSNWRLFRDSPDTLTQGRYYFSPPGTPFYPGTHNLGSRNWNDKNWQAVQSFGEDLQARQNWYSGAVPPILPDNVLVGDADCLANGEQLANALNTEDTTGGFPLGCYLPYPVNFPTWPVLSSIDSCTLQYFYAQMMLLVYARDLTNLARCFNQLVGPGEAVTLVQGTTLLPDIGICRTDEGTAVVVDGTVNYQQGATQAFQGVFGPVNIGIYSTLPLWYDAATWIHNNLVSQGVDFTLPIVLVGHSYGAAAVRNLAARYVAATPSREVVVLTFGDPKPGDIRLQNLSRLTRSIALANDNDLVTILPPDALTLAPITVFLSLYSLLVWDQWKRPVGQQLMLPDGSLIPDASVVTDFDTMLALVVDAIAEQQLNPVTGHQMPTYAARILTRCPAGEWPVTSTLWTTLQNLTNPSAILRELPAVGYVIQEAGSGKILLEL